MNKRYSKYIRLLMLLIDIFIINFVVYFISDIHFLNIYFLAYITIFWTISSLFTGFYKIYRFTKSYRVITLLTRQNILFVLGYFTYFTLFKEGQIINSQAVVLSTIIISIAIFKFFFLYGLKKYRASGKNLRKVIVLGADDSTKKIIKVFNTNKNLGYVFMGFFSDRSSKKETYLGKIKESFQYILDSQIDQVYCSMSELSQQTIKQLTKFTNEHNLVLKLIPDPNELYNKNVVTEFYDDSMLVFNVKKLPFEFAENHFIKRLFDVIFSSFILIFILSWLTPILWVLIKFESKGPVFFKQKREGLNGKQFICYKFRSMQLNRFSDRMHATKNDSRITKVGSFIRKTSMDELPQFYNVLIGDMSVVGPRPHLKNLSVEYQKDVENYLDRHAVKPGITGLAQISGFRGEIKKSADIKNRIRLDIFYIENWSFFLDIKIIIQTALNVFRGEEKAY